jgi:fused signal recognition particle receptor
MVNLLSAWKEGLSKSSTAAFGQITSLLRRTEINPQIWNDLEALLIQADLGLETSSSVINCLKDRIRQSGIKQADQLLEALRIELRNRLESPPKLEWTQTPNVILVVGVNGCGKTTTIAKLAARFRMEGKTILFGATDTFRAAGVDQLQQWAERLNVGVISGAPGSDPGAVAFNSVQAGLARKVDILLLDTAGRLHTRYNLMAELKKIKRVVAKALTGAPHAVWLVLDSTTGQNALSQARKLKEEIGVTSVILAKLDCSARGGMAFAIKHDLGLPILFVGLGEKADDLQPFDPDAFVEGILTSY